MSPNTLHGSSWQKSIQRSKSGSRPDKAKKKRSFEESLSDGEIAESKKIKKTKYNPRTIAKIQKEMMELLIKPSKKIGEAVKEIRLEPKNNQTINAERILTVVHKRLSEVNKLLVTEITKAIETEGYNYYSPESDLLHNIKQVVKEYQKKTRVLATV